MAGQAAAQSSLRLTLTVASGPDQGAIFQLLPPQVTIGRGPENHICLSDPRCSRAQAIIEFTPTKVTIRDLSQRNNMTVNDLSTTEQDLTNGDHIHMGDTSLIFKIEHTSPRPQTQSPVAYKTATMPTMPNAAGYAPTAYAPPTPGPGVRMGPSSDQRMNPMSDDQKAKKKRFYLIITVIGLVFGYLLLSEKPNKHREPQGIRTVDQVEKEIKDAETRVEQQAHKRKFASIEEETRYREAQRHYLEGFRDFEKGQYSRALRSFETALAVDPKHEMADRYRVLSEKERDNAIASLMLDARRYKDKNMYSRCSSALNKVLDEIPNKQDLKYKESQALKKECDANTLVETYEN